MGVKDAVHFIKVSWSPKENEKGTRFIGISSSKNTIVYFDSSIQKSAYVVFSIIWILYFHEIDKDLLKYGYCVKSIDYNQCPLIIKADVVF